MEEQEEVREEGGYLEEFANVKLTRDNTAQHMVDIRQVNNGYIVNVGCQTFVFEKLGVAMTYLSMYFEDPEGTERKFRDGTLFKK